MAYLRLLPKVLLAQRRRHAIEDPTEGLKDTHAQQVVVLKGSLVADPLLLNAQLLSPMQNLQSSHWLSAAAQQYAWDDDDCKGKAACREGDG